MRSSGLARAMKNRRGTSPPISVSCRPSGRETTVFTLLGTAANLLMFYDPDCPSWRRPSKGYIAASGRRGVEVVGSRHRPATPAWDETKPRCGRLDCRLRPRLKRKRSTSSRPSLPLPPTYWTGKDLPLNLPSSTPIPVD